MMPEWIKQQAEKIKKQERAAADQRRVEIQSREVIQEKWLDIWHAVVGSVKRDVTEFNAQFPTDSAKHLSLDAPSDTELTIRRDGRPVRVVKVAASASGIALELIETRYNPPQQEVRQSDMLPFAVLDAGDVVVLIGGDLATIGKVSEEILRPLF